MPSDRLTAIGDGDKREKGSRRAETRLDEPASEADGADRVRRAVTVRAMLQAADAMRSPAALAGRRGRGRSRRGPGPGAGPPATSRVRPECSALRRALVPRRAAPVRGAGTMAPASLRRAFHGPGRPVRRAPLALAGHEATRLRGHRARSCPLSAPPRPGRSCPCLTRRL